MPDQQPTEIPAWANVYEHPCVTAKCTDCGEPYGDPDTGGGWHFDSFEEIRADVARDQEQGYTRWTLADDALLCEGCVASRVCAAQGHSWTHYPASASAHDGHAIPEIWACARGCNTPATRTDPTPGGESS